MIEVITGSTANEVYVSAATNLLDRDIASLQQSRGGVTKEMLHVGLSIANPRERWVIARQPPVNPAFAISEVVWILNGRNDAEFINYWNRQLPKYAGNMDEYHGAYGYRLKFHFGINQLVRAYNALRNNPEGRQIVLQIWDVKSDFPKEDGSPINADIPCNIVSLLKIRDEKLEWAQVMRSNDIFRGMPYDFVQFTTLQEVLAGWLGIGVGSYNHWSDSLHLYESDFSKFLIDRMVIPEPNSDRLMLPKEESDRMFVLLAEFIDQIRTPEITEKELICLSKRQELPIAYWNLLLIVACEVARKNKWNFAELALRSECNNPLLLQTWDRWKTKFAKI